MADRFKARARTASRGGAARALEDDGRDLAALRGVPGEDSREIPVVIIERA